MEEKRKNLMKTGSSSSSGWGAPREDGAREDGGGGGGGPREDGAREDGGGGGGRKSPFVYYTRAVPSSNNWGITEQQYGGTVNF